MGKGKETDSINNNKNNKRTNEDLYDINNFYSSTVKIREKSLYQNVLVPDFEELDDDFFEDNCIEVRFLFFYIIIFRTKKTFLTKNILNIMIYLNKKK